MPRFEALRDWWMPELHTDEERHAFVMRSMIYDACLFVSGLVFALAQSDSLVIWLLLAIVSTVWLVLTVRFFAWCARGRP